MSATSRAKFASLLMASAGTAPLITTPALAQTVYQEVEPNDSKAQANVIDGGGAGMFPGDMMVGETRCTGPCGLYGPDVFLIRTAPAPLGLYRYQLVVSSDNTFNGFSGAMVGHWLLNCRVLGDDELSLRIHALVLGEWYGFGKQERIYWTIRGSAPTTLPYTATLSRSVVPRIATVGPFRPGPIRIDSAQGSPTYRIFPYDASFNALPPTGDATQFFRDFAAGTYHLAIATSLQSCNNLPCPPNEFLTGHATDFPDVIVSPADSSPAAALRFWDTADRTVIVPIPASQFAVQWLTMHVYYDNTCGSPDFNGDGDPATSADIEAFFACLAGDCCLTCDPRGSDFNGDGDSATDADIEAFFRILAGGSC